MNDATTKGIEQQERTFQCIRCHGQVTLQVTLLPSGRFFGLPDEIRCERCRAIVEREQELERIRLAQVSRGLEREQARSRAIALLDTPKIFRDARIATTEKLGRLEESNRRIDRAVFLASKVISAVVHGADGPQLLSFYGPPGSGKTRMVYAIANELAEEFARSVRVVKLSELIRDLRAPWRSKSGPDEQERLDGYVALDFLGIDEVSRHAFYGQSIEQHLWDVINARVEDGRPTVLTTNESREELETIVGPAITSRLRLGGHVPFPEEDFRTLQPREWLNS